MAGKRGHGEGMIRQRSDGRWESRISLSNGKTKSFYGKTRREVQEKLRIARRDLDDGVNIAANRESLADFLDRWLSASVKPSVRPKTYEGYEGIVRVRVVPYLGRTPLTKVTPLDLQTLYTCLSESGLSARSVHHTHRVLHRAFTQALRWGLISRNPCDGVTAPRARRRELHVLTQEQVTRLLDGTRTHPAHALYVLAVTTGMRLGELLGLQWQDVDLVLGELTVRRALQRQREAGLVFVEPKSGRSRRKILLSQRAVTVLKAHKAQQEQRRALLGPDWSDYDLVFPNPNGSPPDPAWQRQVFQEQLRLLGLPVVRFHDLRHTAATLLFSIGTHPKTVSDMLGHATITLTLDTYSHLVPALHAQAAAAMDQLLGT